MIRVIGYDFDGVMTDNTVLLCESGTESAHVNRADGMAVSWFADLGIAQIIITSEVVPIAEHRARKLGIGFARAHGKKAVALAAFCDERGCSLAEAAYVGNDANDMGVMQAVRDAGGLLFVPRDAHRCLDNLLPIQLRADGGRGVVRALWDWADTEGRWIFREGRVG